MLKNLDLVHVRPVSSTGSYRIVCAHAGLAKEYTKKDDEKTLLYHLPVGITTTNDVPKIEWQDFQAAYEKMHPNDTMYHWAGELNTLLKGITVAAFQGGECSNILPRVAAMAHQGTFYLDAKHATLLVALLGGPQGPSPASGQNTQMKPIDPKLLGGISTYLGMGHIPAPFGVVKVAHDTNVFSVSGRSDTQYFRPSMSAQLIVPVAEGSYARDMLTKFLKEIKEVKRWENRHEDLNEANDDTFTLLKGYELKIGPIVSTKGKVYTVIHAQKGLSNFIVFIPDGSKLPVGLNSTNYSNTEHKCEFVAFVFGTLSYYEAESPDPKMQDKSLYSVTSAGPSDVPGNSHRHFWYITESQTVHPPEPTPRR